MVATLSGGFEGWGIGDTSVRSYDVALGDLDGDDDLDVFAANYQYLDGSPAPDWVFINDGDGSLRSGAGFAWTEQRLGPFQSRSVELGDVDGDGDLDAITAAVSPDSNHLWLNDGNANFTESGQPLGPGSEHVALGDVDGDGDLDLFIATDGANQVWLNDGDGGFADSGQRLGNSNSSHVVMGDLDLDGDLDAFIANWEGDANTAWVNDGVGNFSDSGLRLASTKSTEHVALGDLDGDGDLDLVSAGWGSANHIYFNTTIVNDLEPPEAVGITIAEGSVFVQFSEPVQNIEAVSLFRGPLIEAEDLQWNERGDGFTWAVELEPGEHDLFLHTSSSTSTVEDLVGNRFLDGFSIHENGGDRFFGHRLRLEATFAGDLDSDFDVDFADFLALSTNFGSTNATPDDGDIDRDGIVTFADFLMLSANFGKS